MGKRVQLRERLHTQKRGAIGGSSPSEKYRSNTRCPKCNLLFQDGVWKNSSLGNGQTCQWKLCPACAQIRDGQIGGIVQCSGAFTGTHRQELLNRIRNVEKLTREERPLERIIQMKEDREGITISATTEHLVARIGKSIQRDFGGELELRYAPDENFAFVHWHRD
jgi:NMD protein affecting ribosome stability and mRNA decay